VARSEIFEITVEHFLAPIMCYMKDESVGEIMINRFDEIYIEQKGKLTKTDAAFASEDSLRSAVNNVLQYTGKRVSEEHPLIDSRLPDGSRVHVVLSPLCRGGTCMTIRKFAKVMFDAEHLIEVGTWTRMAVDYLSVYVGAEKNMLVAGGTSSGKNKFAKRVEYVHRPEQPDRHHRRLGGVGSATGASHFARSPVSRPMGTRRGDDS